MATSYKIKSGDTLSAIAAKYGVTVQAIASANGIANPNKIQAGQTISIPVAASAAKPGAPATPPAGQNKTVDVTATNAARETAVKQGKDPSNIYVYKTSPAAGGGGSAAVDTSWLNDNEDYKALTPDDQKFISSYAETLASNDVNNQKILAQALEDAKAAADPYFKEKIRIVQDELLGALGEQKSDFASKKAALEQKIADITTDLKTGKDRLSIDEQAELARQGRTYKNQLDNLMENVSSTGLTFSTKRTLAESQLATENADVVESTQRSFQRQLEDLQLQADRGSAEAKKAIADYERIYGENVTKLVRGAEANIGTGNLPDVSGSGAAPLGGISGSIETEKMNDITARAEALASLRNPFL